MDIKYEPIKTHDDEGNRFVLTIDDSYLDVISSLEYVKDELQGEEYE